MSLPFSLSPISLLLPPATAGRLQSVLKSIPVYVVIIDEVGLVGSAVLALRILAEQQAAARAKL